MTSRVRIFDRKSLQALAQFSVSATYSWKLNDIGRCEFEMASVGNDKCKESFLQFGNLVYIEHLPTQKEDGSLNGVLPTWVGVLAPPRNWSVGKVVVNAFSGEYFLKKRPLPLTSANGVSSVMFNTIIGYAFYTISISVHNKWT